MRELISYIASKEGFRKIIRNRVKPRLKFRTPNIPNLVWKLLLKG